MSRYPREARGASIKCIQCNAPVTRTIDETYICVECGRAPLSIRTDTSKVAEGD